MNKFLLSAIPIALMCFTLSTHAQAPVLGTSSNFALFSSNGAVTDAGMSLITGNVGTNIGGPSSNFGNIDGVINDGNGTTLAAAADLTTAYNQLNAAVPDFFPASSLLGNGQTLTAGTYLITEAATLTNTLTLDGGGNADAVFIFKIEGAFSSASGAQVLLTNGALACNVFWKVEGLVTLATNTAMKGTIVANNAAIVLNTGVSLEGRALSTTGAVTVSGVTVAMPLGCGVPVLTGPEPPQLNSVVCYAVFSGNGAVTNDGVSFVTGDIGTNMELTTGFQAENTTGTIHPGPDPSTAQCAADLNNVYTYLNTLSTDIELLSPATFGQDLVLTPHTYLLNAATALTGTLILNAQGNADAVFVIKINGALSTSTGATVSLQNGAQAKNVFWKIDGATSLNNDATFKGTVIGNNGAVILNNGVAVEGRVLTTSGAISTFGINVQITAGCTTLGTNSPVLAKQSARFYPNPFSNTLHVALEDNDAPSQLTIYNALGAKTIDIHLSGSNTVVPINLPAGIYYYKLVDKNGLEQRGKLISK
ncbi:MAG TPA: ice-binding family protein [Flavobacterium sp.]|jgi:hypothetical protein